MNRRRKEKFRPILPRSGPCLTPKTKQENPDLLPESIVTTPTDDSKKNILQSSENENIKEPTNVVNKSSTPVLSTKTRRRRRNIPTPVLKPKPGVNTVSEKVVPKILEAELVEQVCDTEDTTCKEIVESSQPELTELKPKLPPDINIPDENLNTTSVLSQPLNDGFPEVSPTENIPLSPPATQKKEEMASQDTNSLNKLSTHIKPIPKQHHLHGRNSVTRRRPNFEQANRIRHDSIRETVVRENHHRQNALSKLKALNEKSKSDSDGNKPWPELDRNVISMSDLIYINPPEGTGKELGLRVEMRQIKDMKNRASVEAPSTPSRPSIQSASQDEEEPSLAPQIRINEDGTVVIDEESLSVKSAPKPSTFILDGPAVFENGLNNITTQTSFRRRPIARGCRWTDRETGKFYSALKVVGADFELMAAMFKRRKPDELRRKFHNESRRNCKKVDHALEQQHLSKWTDEMFQLETSSEEEDVVKKPAKRRRKLKAKESKTITEVLEALPVAAEAEMPIAETVEVNTSAEDCDIVSQIICDIDNSAVPVA